MFSRSDDRHELDVTDRKQEDLVDAGGLLEMQRRLSRRLDLRTSRFVPRCRAATERCLGNQVQIESPTGLGSGSVIAIGPAGMSRPKRRLVWEDPAHVVVTASVGLGERSEAPMVETGP